MNLPPPPPPPRRQITNISELLERIESLEKRADNHDDRLQAVGAVSKRAHDAAAEAKRQALESIDEISIVREQWNGKADAIMVALRERAEEGRRAGRRRDRKLAMWAAIVTAIVPMLSNVVERVFPSHTGHVQTVEVGK